MLPIVCLSAPNTIGYTTGGGHLWVFLNWALGLRANGCRVFWLDTVSPEAPTETSRAAVAGLAGRLGAYGFADSIVVVSSTGAPLPRELSAGSDLDEAVGADLLLNFRYDLPASTVARFRRSAFVDIDPGVLQLAVECGQLTLASHDVYFTTGETVGTADARFPTGGLPWRRTRPCVATEWWPTIAADADAPFTTVSHWYMNDWIVEPGGAWYADDKRSGFLPYLDLPRLTNEPLALALYLDGDDRERAALEARGWRIQDSAVVAATPELYQGYIQRSRGEFSCVKPHCVRMQNAWVSDRTLCYLSSGKPVVVEHTGPSRILPDSAGMFRFHTIEEAVTAIERVVADYPNQCRLARRLAVEHFEARAVVRSVLEEAFE